MSKASLGSPKSRIKEFAKNSFNPLKSVKFYAKGTVRDLKAAGDAIKPDTPKEDPAVTALRDRQTLDLAKLDEEQNLRIKSLFAGARGGRFFRGSPLLRTGGSRTPTGGAASGGSMFVPRTPSRDKAY